MTLKKIHIIGIHGSGKTTLAKKISMKLKIPFYSFDDIKYLIKWSKQRPIKDSKKLIAKITKQSKWVTEGSWSDYAGPAFKKAELIIILKPKKLISKYRIFKRYLFRKKEEEDTLKGVLKLIRRIKPYYKSEEPVSLFAHLNLIKENKKNYLILKSNKEINNFLKELK